MGLLRSWFPFGVERRTPFSAGMDVTVRRDANLSPGSPFVPILGRLVNAGEPAYTDDGSAMGSCTYPYSTLLDGIPGRIPGYRLLSPLHTIEGQSHAWGTCCHLCT